MGRLCYPTCPDRKRQDASIRAVPIAIGTWYFSRKAVTSLTLTERSERYGVQGGFGALFACR